MVWEGKVGSGVGEGKEQFRSGRGEVSSDVRGRKWAVVWKRDKRATLDC